MIRRVLTIAGSDSGGGAGIQADLKTFENIGVYGMSAITAVTAQNTIGVQRIYQLPADFVASQIDSVMSDIGADGTKTGMLGSHEVVEVVAEKLRFYRFKHVVVDPVIIATSGDPLLEEEAIGVIREKLIPCAHIITPNLDEAQVLSGIKIGGDDTLKEIASVLHDMGAAAVLLKGGHSASEEVTDLFYDGKKYTYFRSQRIMTKNTHGTGCTLSSALLAYLCLGMEPLEAVKAAREYVYERLKRAKEGSVGRGYGPISLPGEHKRWGILGNQ